MLGITMHEKGLKMRRLALTKDGRLTYCACLPGEEGKGRCNHVKHQMPGQSTDDFMSSIENEIAVDDVDDSVTGAGKEEYSPFQYDMQEHKELVASMPDNSAATRKLVQQFGITKDPDWESVVRSIKNPFTIGSVAEGTYEEAELVSVDKTPVGDDYHLTLKYVFRGKKYTLEFGDVPIVDESGCITINGGKWRPLPVLEQNKAGVVSYLETTIIKQDDGNLALTIPKDPDVDYVIIRGTRFSIEDVQNYWKTGDRSKFTSGQLWSLDHIDPAAEERFPRFKSHLSDLKMLSADEPGDITDRRVIRYEDMVQKQMAIQARRMGVTFRTNLAKQQAAREQGMSEEEINEKFPLFYQKNLTDNIRRDLVGCSNVQTADVLNPISALSQAQKVSLTGPGGYNKDKVPYGLRMPHPSHKGVVDPLVASAGKNVGLTACISGGYIGSDRYIHRKSEGESISPSDFIPYKYHNDPSRANMACSHLTQACPITGGEDPLVSTPAWNSIKGAKLGINLKVAYIPDKDAFEDAVVLSESAAVKMSTVQTQQYRCYHRGELANLKVGQRVERKMHIGGVDIKYGGVIKSISDDGFEVETVFPMTVGDKISNRHGGKSIIAKIRKDKDMPHILNESTGQLEPADIIMTPMGVVGRKNLGQIMECNEAAEMTGLHVHQDGREATDINRSGTVIASGHKVDATCGVEYVMRLNHIAEKKLSSHADELDASRESEGTRLGEMESILLSTDKDRLRILNYLRHQDAHDAHNKLHNLLRSIGVDMSGVNWNG